MKSYLQFIVGMLATTQVWALTFYLPEHLEQFKQTRSCLHCNLSGIRLRDQVYKNVILTGSDLIKADLYNSTFEEANFSSALLNSDCQAIDL